MANPHKLRVIPLETLALPYISGAAPISDKPFIPAAYNIMRRKRGPTVWIEQRPGWGTSFADINGTSRGVDRLFGWKRWGSSYVVMASGSGSGGAADGQIFKRVIGTDGNFVSLGVISGAGTTPFDFETSNNHVYMSNGTSGTQNKYDATNFTTWGITQSGSAPTTSTSGTGITATVGWKYVYCWYNSTTGHVSSPSPASASTGAVANKTVAVTAARNSVDSQVDQVRIFRTVDGGDGIYFECSGSPIANPGAGSWTFNDTTADSSLSSTYAPVNNVNDPPVAMRGLTLYANRIWGYANDKVYFSAFEESTIGVAEESYPPTNRFTFGSEVRGIARVADGLLVFLPTSVWKITGDSLSTFRRRSFYTGFGLLSQRGLASSSQGVFWLSSDNTVRFTDGVSEPIEVGEHIRSDIATLNPAKSSLTYHSDGVRQWVLLSTYDSAFSVPTMWCFDLDFGFWQGQWTLNTSLPSNSTVASVQTADGTAKLLYSAGAYVYENTGAVYTDGDSSAAQNAITNINFATTEIDLAGPGKIVSVDHIITVTDTNNPSTVSFNPDDQSPLNGKVITAKVVAPAPYRTQGTYMLEKWYYTNSTTFSSVCRWMGYFLAWSSGSNANKLYSLAVAVEDIQNAG